MRDTNTHPHTMQQHQPGPRLRRRSKLFNQTPFPKLELFSLLFLLLPPPLLLRGAPPERVASSSPILRVVAEEKKGVFSFLLHSLSKGKEKRQKSRTQERIEVYLLYHTLLCYKEQHQRQTRERERERVVLSHIREREHKYIERRKDFNERRWCWGTARRTTNRRI